MANKILIGTWIAPYGLGSFDTFETFFDLDTLTTTDTFTVNLNGSNLLVGSAPIIDENTYVNPYPQATAGFSPISPDGTQSFTFSPIDTWPYWELVGEDLFTDTGTNDIKAFADYVTPATDEVTADGSIIVYASGTNNPLTVNLGTGAKSMTTYAGTDNLFQYEYTFTGLPAGNYEIVVKDLLGFSVTLNVVLPLKEQTNEASYGILYSGEYSDSDHNTEKDYKVEILKRGYSGSVTTLTEFGASPFTLSTTASGRELHELTLLKTKANIELHSDTDQKFIDIARADDKEYKVKHYIDNGGYELLWEGFVQPSSYSEQYSNPGYITNLEAHDRTGVFSDEKFENERINEESFGGDLDIATVRKTALEGEFTELYIINFCLKKTGLYQDIRVAVNLFEDSHTTTNRTPLDQTYIDVASYYKDGEGISCEDVLINILRPYGAYLVNHGGYWYIIRWEELESSSVTYQQYDKDDLTRTSGGTWSPRITYKAAGSTNYWRHKGQQSLSFTDNYRLLNFRKKLNLVSETGGLFGDETDIDFNGWEFFYDSTADFVIDKREAEDGKRRWTVGLPRTQSNSFLLQSGELETSRTTRFKITFKHKTYRIADSEDVNKGPYYPLKWSLKVGDKFVDSGGAWNDVVAGTSIIQQEFIEDLNQELNFEFETTLYADTSPTKTYEFRLYVPSVFDYDLSVSTVEEIFNTENAALVEKPTVDTAIGARIIVFENALFDKVRHYYELRSSSIQKNNSFEEVWPADFNASTNPKKWVLVESWEYVDSAYAADDYGGWTQTELSDFKFELFPNGKKAPTEDLFRVVADVNNTRDIDIDIFHYDLENKISSDDYIYNNYTRLSDGTATDSWSYNSGTARTRQQLLAEYLAERYSRARYLLNSEIFCDTTPTPINVFYDNTNESEMTFIAPSMEFNYKNQSYSGDMMEIKSDDTPDYRDWNSDDWNNNDWA